MEREIEREETKTVTQTETVYFCDDCGEEFDRSELVEFESDEYEEALLFCQSCIEGETTVTKGLNRVRETVNTDGEVRGATKMFLLSCLAFIVISITFVPPFVALLLVGMYAFAISIPGMLYVFETY